ALEIGPGGAVEDDDALGEESAQTSRAGSGAHAGHDSGRGTGCIDRPARDPGSGTTFVCWRLVEASAAPEGDRFGEAAAFLRGRIRIQVGVVPLQEAPPRAREADGGAADG